MATESPRDRLAHFAKKMVTHFGPPIRRCGVAVGNAPHGAWQDVPEPSIWERQRSWLGLNRAVGGKGIIPRDVTLFGS